MVDVGTITAAINGIKAASEIARLLKESDLSLDKAEQKLKLAELISALADVKMEMAEIQQVIIDRDKKIRELEEAQHLKVRLKWQPPVYWLIDDMSKEGPFCQKCYDSDGKLVRLHDGDDYWRCKVCACVFPKVSR